MKAETNRIEYKQHFTNDLEKEAVAFLYYHEIGIAYIDIRKIGTPIGVMTLTAICSKLKIA